MIDARMDPLIPYWNLREHICRAKRFHFRGVGTSNQNHRREYQNAPPSCFLVPSPEHSMCQPGRPGPMEMASLLRFFRPFQCHEIHWIFLDSQ